MNRVDIFEVGTIKTGGQIRNSKFEIRN